MAFRRHAAGLLDGESNRSRHTVALDGTVLRRSFDNFRDRKAAQLLHAFDTEFGLVFAHVDIDEMSNETPAVQQLLGELHVAHSTITIDALHCQKTFVVAAQAQAQAIIQLKDNQPGLVQNAEATCARQQPTSSETSITKARNWRETRTVDVFSAAHAVADTEWKHLIKDVVRVTRDVLHRSARTGLWSTTAEVAYYLTGFDASAGQAGSAIRNHWRIENSLHYTRDVTFQEDQSRIRCNPGIFARIRSFAYNILRRNQTTTFNQQRYAAALAELDALAEWNSS
jgi:predicted transposase YbfD/YdcC